MAPGDFPVVHICAKQDLIRQPPRGGSASATFPRGEGKCLFVPYDLLFLLVDLIPLVGFGGEALVVRDHDDALSVLVRK